MAIDYVEIRDNKTALIGIIDAAHSIIWHSVYFGVGDFEIHTKATPEAVELLKIGNFVTRPDDIEIGIIEKIDIANDEQSGLMITAAGKFAKNILSYRLIYNLAGTVNTATILRGNVEENIRNLVLKNAIACSFDSKRNIALLELGTAAGIPAIIVDENGNAAQKQVSYENLLTYTEAVLKEYGLASIVVLDINTKKLQYSVYSGIDRSIDNSSGNIPIVFSQEFDNLTASAYSYDTTAEKNTALIGGEGEGIERFYSLLAKTESDLQRREVFIDAASIKKTLKSSEIIEMFPSGVFSGINFVVGGVTYATLVIDDNDKEYSLKALQEKFPKGTTSGTKFIVGGVTYANKVYGDDENYTLTPIGYKAMLDVEEKEGNYLLTDAVYSSLLKSKGKQDLLQLVKLESFEGTIDIINGNWVYNRDFSLGDIVTVQDNAIKKYINVRIMEITEVQDENGYNIEAVYQS